MELYKEAIILDPFNAYVDQVLFSDLYDFWMDNVLALWLLSIACDGDSWLKVDLAVVKLVHQLLSILRICHRAEVVIWHTIVNAELGSILASWLLERHRDQILMLWLHHFQVDPYFWIEIVVALEDWDHRVIQQTAFEVCLATDFFD